MPWLYYLILLAIDLVGLVLTAFTLPGLWLMLGAAALFSLLTHGQYLGWHVLLVLLIVTTAAEVGEIYLGGAGAKKEGASKWGIVGGFIGAIIGGIFLTFIPIPILNHVIGICLGTFLGAFGVEMFLGKPFDSSLKIGVGAARGRLFGIVGKLAVGFGMLLLTIVAAFPHHFRTHAFLPGVSVSSPTTHASRANAP